MPGWRKNGEPEQRKERFLGSVGEREDRKGPGGEASLTSRSTIAEGGKNENRALKKRSKTFVKSNELKKHSSQKSGRPGWRRRFGNSNGGPAFWRRHSSSLRKEEMYLLCPGNGH